jgi:hypothetical protein
MVREVLTSKEVDGEVLTDNQREGIQFAIGMRWYLDSPGNELSSRDRAVRDSGSRNGSRRTLKVRRR